MRSVQVRLHNFYQMFSALPCDVRHYVRQSKYPYMVWTEREEDSYHSLDANNRKAEQMINGTVDYFTKREFDSTVDTIQDILDAAESVAWYLDAVQYEDETGLIHYTWTWRLS